MTNLVKYDEARRALAVAVSVDEAKDIRDKAAALEAYARQKNDIEMERWVAEIKLRAITRIGEISAKLETVERRRSDLHPNDGKQTKTEVLRRAGISTSAAHRAETLAAHKDQVEAYIQRKAEKREPVKYTEILHAVEMNKREQERKEILQRPVKIRLEPGLHRGDFRELSDMIADESVELVFTDPPYDAESAVLYEDAARVAARILKPGGSFIAYSGQTQLPAVLAGCGKHLRYWWTIAGVHSGGNQLLQKLGIRCGWKPLVWFVKGTRGDVQNILLDVVTGDREKAAHQWQQAESEAAYYIENLTSPHGLVVDFFIGGGTTAVAAKKLGRPWIGFEVDASAAERASERLRGIAA